MKEIKFTNFIKLKINKLDEEYFMDFGFRLLGNDCIIYKIIIEEKILYSEILKY